MSGRSWRQLCPPPVVWPAQSQPSCFWTLGSLLGIVGCQHGNPMAKFLREALLSLCDVTIWWWNLDSREKLTPFLWQLYHMASVDTLPCFSVLGKAAASLFGNIPLKPHCSVSEPRSAEAGCRVTRAGVGGWLVLVSGFLYANSLNRLE